MARKQQSVYEIKVKGLDDIKSLNTEISKLNGRYDELSKESKKASESTKKVGKASKDSKTQIANIAKGAAIAGLALQAFNKASKVLTQELKKGVEVFKGYEFAMAKVKAISGANTEEFAKLDKTAQALGRSTFFTAEQVANLQLNFSKLGFTSTEVLKVQNAALVAATATGEDLARTATVIGSTIRGFGLDASEGARVSDVMAASFTSSALTLEKFQTSMTKVSPVAKLLGMDLEETTAVMGVLTDAGIEASIAGTSLRNIFLKLGDPSSDLAKSIGFTVNSGEDMVREFRRMRDEGVNVEKMLKVVDVRQVAAISTMIEHIDKIESQTEAFRDSTGSAQDMADTIGESLQGATLRFQSALDGLRIVLVEKIAPALTSTLDNFAKLFNLFAKANEVSLSETFEKDRIKMNALVLSTSQLKEGTDERIKAVKTLKRQYPKYFSDLDAEKTKNDDLEKSLKKANAQYLNRIALRTKEEEIEDIMMRASERDETLEQQLEDFNTKVTEFNKTYFNEQLDVFGKTKKEVVELLRTAIQESENLDMGGVSKGKTTKEGLLFRNIEALLIGSEGSEKAKQSLKDELTKAMADANKLAKEFGLDLFGADTGGTTTTTTTTTTGTPAGDVVDPVAEEMARLELELMETLNTQKLMFYDKEIETKEDLNNALLKSELIYLNEMLNIENLSAEQRIGIEQKIADIKVKNREADIKQTEDAEKAKSDLIKANIDNAMGIGKSLTEIGKLMGENSAAAKAGIAVTKAASVAKAIEGIINAKTAIADQAASGDPYSAFARMALMASAVAPLIASLMALKGGGGGQATEEPSGEMFEQGGLTRGGMFVGNSHANGGVKFRVGGRVMEAEGGEAIINKKSTSMFRPVLSAINSYNGNGVKFADGGLLNSGEKFAMGGELRSAQQLVSGGMGTSKVVIVESDMTEVQNRISAIESQATF
jgi:TP901 family phage tail tape measure protein